VHAETVGVQGVDEVVGRRGHVGEDAEPAERVAALVRLQFAGAESLPAHPVVTVGADDEVGLELVHAAVAGVDDGRLRPREADRLDVFCLEDDVGTDAFVLGEQIGHDGLLSVDGDRAADELLEVDVVALALVLQVDAAVREALLTQSAVEAELGQDVDGPLLEHAGPDAAEHVLPRPLLEDRERHVGLAQDVTQEEAGWTCSDDRHTGLFAHGCRLSRRWAVSRG
jgi:hypothetical protein